MTGISATLMAAIQALTGAVEAETQCLRDGDFAALSAAAERKQQAAAAYEQAMKALAATRGIAAKLPEVTRRDLRAAAKRLELALSDNTRLVSAMRAAGTTLIGRILEAASQPATAGGYTAAGRIAAEPTALTAYGERV